MSCQKKERLLIFNLILRKGNGKLEIDSKREGYSCHFDWKSRKYTEAEGGGWVQFHPPSIFFL